MKQFIILIVMGATLFLGACKKEECPELEPDLPYTSTMKGEVSSGIRYSIIYVGSGVEQACDGWFLWEVYNSLNDSVYHSGYIIQVVEGLSDSLKEWNNYHEKEFIIDFEFIGTGYECVYDDGLGSFINTPPPSPVEQIKITKIEEAP